MNIVCREKGEEYVGQYVSAPSRGKAKALYAHEYMCDYTDVRTEIIRRGVNTTVIDCLSDETPEQVELLKQLGLQYDYTGEDW